MLSALQTPSVPMRKTTGLGNMADLGKIFPLLNRQKKNTTSGLHSKLSCQLESTSNCFSLHPSVSPLVHAVLHSLPLLPPPSDVTPPPSPAATAAQEDRRA